MKKVTISLYVVLLSIGIIECGDSSIEKTLISSSLNKQELYTFHIKSNDATHKYQMKNFDSRNHSLSPYFFDFTAKEYIVNSQETTVLYFINYV